MADWKQITARIRRARTAKDPAGQLSNLYEKTRDAMVAFELAKYFESTGLNADSAKWYLTAADRFRRADWKTKAQEAAVRLGGEIPAGTSAPSSEAIPDDAGNRIPGAVSTSSQSDSQDDIADEDTQQMEANVAFSSQVQAATDAAPETAASEAEKKRRRRGRRGGKNRRKPGVTRDAANASTTRTSTASTQISAPSASEETEPVAPRTPHARSMPNLPVEAVGDPGGASVKGRFGDPGLSSRMSLMEMQFRRLLTCTPAKLEEADRAPVGPGVFVLTDSDLTSYYYVETCQTLRIAVSNLLRGNPSRRGVDSIKPRLAEHLGIPEARVAKYLADHCVVRWLQLDEGASHFAHFVISMLRPVLNE